MKCSGISVLGRVTSGVKLIDLKEGDIVASIAKVRKGDEEDNEEDNFVENGHPMENPSDMPEEGFTENHEPEENIEEDK